MQTVRDVVSQDSVDISLRVDAQQFIDHSKLAYVLHCSDAEGTRVTFTAFSGNDCADREFATGTWYSFENVNTSLHGHSVGILPNWGNERIAELGTPPTRRDHPGPTEDATVVQVGASNGFVAFDIELLWTVPPEERDINDLSCDEYEIAAVGVGAKPSPDVDPEVEAITRTERGPDAELECIETAVEWLAARDASTILTYNGAGFDYPRILERAEAAADACDADQERVDRVRHVLSSYYHADLMNATDRDFERGPLEDIAAAVDAPADLTYWADFDHGLDPHDWTDESDTNPYVTGRDFPELADRYLDWRHAEGDTHRVQELQACMNDYAKADITPLFAIAEDDRITDYGAPNVKLLDE